MRNKLLRRARFAAALIPLAASVALAQERTANAETSNATETAEFHLGRGHEALKYNRYQEAVNEFRAALALDPTLVVRARFPLAVALFSVQEREQARQEFEKVRAETGDDPNTAYYLGRLDLMEGNLDSAIKNLTLAATDHPSRTRPTIWDMPTSRKATMLLPSGGCARPQRWTLATSAFPPTWHGFIKN